MTVHLPRQLYINQPTTAVPVRTAIEVFAMHVCTGSIDSMCEKYDVEITQYDVHNNPSDMLMATIP